MTRKKAKSGGKQKGTKKEAKAASEVEVSPPSNQQISQAVTLVVVKFAPLAI